MEELFLIVILLLMARVASEQSQTLLTVYAILLIALMIACYGAV
tara:strand:+ start:530 stop:661 length:132 start_codon:yes stop_codon:yes gene_type:complete